jgi:hypothetical protein
MKADAREHRLAGWLSTNYTGRRDPCKSEGDFDLVSTIGLSWEGMDGWAWD